MTIITILYLFLPAAFANIGAALSAKFFPQWSYPLDCNKKFRGIRILGDHKTIRGFVFGVLCAGIIYLFQIALYSNPFFRSLSFINYDTTPYYFGLLLGLGAVSGDALKSFFKRQFQVKPGDSWMPFDQIDWISGALIATSSIMNYRAGFLLITLLLFFFLHVIIKFIGYLLHLDSAPL